MVKQAFLRSIPVLMGYSVLGIAFGLLLHSIGYNWIWALLISTTVFAGSMQFVLVGLLAEQAPLATVAITTLLVNSRHLFYGLSFIERFKAMGKKGLYMIFSLTDETYALLCGVPEDEQGLSFTIAALNQLYWIVGSVIGALLGSLISFNTAGIEFAMTALFSVIVVEQWLSGSYHSSALIGAGCAILSLVVLGPSHFLLPALIVTLLFLLVVPESTKEGQ
ncbi:MAG: AzlC family ABC transporter permease [Sphaerochaetaceae bacterium]